uniref:Uncharacterized protein n=1 Tax=Glossina austeni TaxID=7395 RepID=A0A1A9ULH9_GLOAU
MRLYAKNSNREHIVSIRFSAQHWIPIYIDWESKLTLLLRPNTLTSRCEHVIATLDDLDRGLAVELLPSLTCLLKRNCLFCISNFGPNHQPSPAGTKPKSCPPPRRTFSAIDDEFTKYLEKISALKSTFNLLQQSGCTSVI